MCPEFKRGTHCVLGRQSWKTGEELALDRQWRHGDATESKQADLCEDTKTGMHIF